MSVHRIITTFLLLLFATWAQAQGAYPNKPVRLIVPFPAGGSADLIARSIAQQFSENTKQPMIIENRPGADTIIGMQAVKNAAPDGYTVGYAIGSSLTMNPVLYKKLPYAVADFDPVMVVADLASALVVNPSLPAKSVAELAGLIKANPNQYFYGQGNILSKVSLEAFAQAAGGRMTEVAYKGGSASVMALVAGEVQVLTAPADAVAPFVKDGKIRMLAMTGARRSAAFPDVATVAESGLPDFVFNNWHAIVLPARTPPDIVRRLHAELARAARHPDLIAKFAPLGIDIIAGSPEELSTRIQSESVHWAKKIATLRSLGIQLD
jgi:tripartite-type tricarboxylate transporter receptor subunit TctC